MLLGKRLELIEAYGRRSHHGCAQLHELAVCVAKATQFSRRAIRFDIDEEHHDRGSSGERLPGGQLAGGNHIFRHSEKFAHFDMVYLDVHKLIPVIASSRAGTWRMGCLGCPPWPVNYREEN